MSAIEQVMLERFRVLPLEKQREALNLIAALVCKTALQDERVVVGGRVFQ